MVGKLERVKMGLECNIYSSSSSKKKPGNFTYPADCVLSVQRNYSYISHVFALVTGIVPPRSVFAVNDLVAVAAAVFKSV